MNDREWTRIENRRRKMEGRQMVMKKMDHKRMGGRQCNKVQKGDVGTTLSICGLITTNKHKHVQGLVYNTQ